MIAGIVGTLCFLALGFAVWGIIADIGYDTTPWAQVRRGCSHYTDAYRQGLACITFDFFVSLYQVNPDRWELEDPTWGYIRYKGENLYWYDRVYWKTREDIKQYKKWYKEELVRQSEHKSAEKIKEISEIGLKDIEALKNKINQNVQFEFERIDKERENNKSRYYQIMTSNGYTLTEEGLWVKNESV